MSEPEFLNSRIILGVTGGIAAYKSADLCRQLIKAGAEVQIIMTRSATEFITPLTLETLTGRPAYFEMFERNRAWEIEHISFARWGHALVIAPATANIIAKMALGLADDPLSTTALAFRGPVLVAPAMNTAMWEHPRTRENVEILRSRGVRFAGPVTGQLACGETAMGCLAPLDEILAALREALAARRPTGSLSAKRVLITAGPTVESIDPVRHLSNPSSGRMGFAVAAEAAQRGAQVTLICGPTPLAPPRDLACVVRVRSACEMRDAVLSRLEGQDVCVFAAAVSDYTPVYPADRKIKKAEDAERITLELKRTPDVAHEAGKARRPGQFLVGFAAETEELAANARRKMEAKGFDVVVGNEVSALNPAFDCEENAVTLFSRSGRQETLPRAPKTALAGPMWDFIEREMRTEE